MAEDRHVQPRRLGKHGVRPGDHVSSRSCPQLKTLMLHGFGLGPPWTFSVDDAFAVAETMPGLRNLQLFGNGLTDAGLTSQPPAFYILFMFQFSTCMFSFFGF